MTLLPALAAHGMSLLHLPPHLPPRHSVSGPGTQCLTVDPHIQILVRVLGVPLDSRIQAHRSSPVHAADAPSSTQGKVGLIYWLAVGLVVTQWDHQCLLGADSLTAPM